MKIYTVARFLSKFGCPPERKGLVPSWHVVPGGKIWGVRCRALPDGEYDAEDSQADGVSEVEEIDSGEDVVRADQQERKFNVLSDQIGKCAAAAIHIAAALAESDAEASGGACSEDADDDGGSESESDEEQDCKPAFLFNNVPSEASM